MLFAASTLEPPIEPDLHKRAHTDQRHPPMPHRSTRAPINDEGKVQLRVVVTIEGLDVWVQRHHDSQRLRGTSRCISSERLHPRAGLIRLSLFDQHDEVAAKACNTTTTNTNNNTTNNNTTNNNTTTNNNVTRHTSRWYHTYDATEG